MPSPTDKGTAISAVIPARNRVLASRRPDLVGHRHPGVGGVAHEGQEVGLRKADPHVALHRPAEPVEIPGDERLIEPDLRPDRLDRLGRRPLPENRLREISGEAVDGDEDHHRHDQKRQQPKPEPLQDDQPNRSQIPIPCWETRRLWRLLTGRLTKNGGL
jgi:hypothetical protein